MKQSDEPSLMEAPDLRPHFKHLHWRPMPHSGTVPVASDFADRPANDPVFGLYKRCGLWELREVDILFSVASQVGGKWLDLGCHTGWTSAYQAAAGCEVTAVDNMLPVPEFRERFLENTAAWDIKYFAVTTNEYFASIPEDQKFTGVVIDADHDHPCPLIDAQNALKHLEERGVIMLHDAIGRPVQVAAEYLVSQGFKRKTYSTVHMVDVCWRGEWLAV